MSIGSKILFYLLSIYIFVLPVVPSKFAFKNIPINGDAILALIIVIYCLELLIFAGVRKNFVSGLKDLWQKPMGIVITIFIGIMFISISYATDKKVALGESIRFSTYIVMYFIIKYQINYEEALKKLLGWYMTTAVFVSIIGISQFFRGIGRIQHTSGGIEFTHVASTIENSNNLGMFLIFAIFPLIMLAIKETNKLRKMLYVLGAIFVFTALLFTYSRNAWLGFAIGSLILVLIYSRKLVFLLLGVGILSTFVPAISERIKQVTDMSQNISRLKLWKLAYVMIKDHPILGIGIGNFKVLYSEYVKKYKELQVRFVDGYDHPHNALLKFQTETGILGSISFAGIMITILLRIIKYVKKSEDQYFKTFYQGFLASLIAFISMNVIDSFFSAPKAIAFFWFLIAVAEALLFNLENKEKYNWRYQYEER